MWSFFNQQWWKWACAFLLIYVVVAGLVVPLGPGITSVHPFVFQADSVYEFRIRGYRTHFSEKNHTQVWFKASHDIFCALDVKIIHDGLIQARFGINRNRINPAADNVFDVIINNDEDGTIALREAITLLRTVANRQDSALVNQNTCEPEVRTNKASAFVFPHREILYESIRNTFYHVPMWFTMLGLIILSAVFSISFLQSGDLKQDILAASFAEVALFFGLMGILTGMVWANYTWGAPWPNDPKLNGAAVGVLIYVAYIILRGSVNDDIKRARLSAVYSVFASVIFILFIFIIPRLPDTDSLHPGIGGNPAFSKYDLDSRLRLVFYPAVIGWMLLGVWLSSIVARIAAIKSEKY
ncbi:MAG: cytochrome c biogenesis protein CcsA [Chitinophagales bacterium]|nr:cytochrome c biogenesis protein [Chitinophagales bacterium]MDW8274499.1 cytochrome c biogenesis protein CcsA [Chitinophagales bacterium]